MSEKSERELERETRQLVVPDQGDGKSWREKEPEPEGDEPVDEDFEEIEEEDDEVTEVQVSTQSAPTPQRGTARRVPRPLPNKKSPVKMLGSYVGIAVDVHNVDLEKIGQELYDAGYSAISFFLTTCFHNTSPQTWPWPIESGKFNYGKINKTWRDWLRKVVETMAYYRIRCHMAFVDQFHETGDNKSADPFRQGLFGNREFDAAPLYDSVTFGPVKFWWLKWSDLPGNKYGNYQTIGEFGKGMELYINEVVAICKEVKELKNDAGKPLYSDFSISWKWANETYTVYDPATNHVDNVRGDRDEIVYWIWNKFKAAGFATGPRYRPYFDYFCRDKGGDRPKDPYYPAMAEQQYWIWRKYQAHLEIHGILTTSDIEKYKKASFRRGTTVYTLQGSKSLFSTDGDLGMRGEYKELGAGTDPVDLKLDTTAGKPFFPDNYQMFWDAYFPRYKTYIPKA